MIEIKFKQSILATAATLFFSLNNSLAMDNQVKIGGLYEFQTIYYKNNGKPEQRVLSSNNREFGLNTSGHIFVDYQLISENNHKYGAKISLEHTSANDRAAPFYVYYESDLGRIEAGAESSAGKKMRITGYSASCATGNGWNSVTQLSPNLPGTSDKSVAYITNFCSFLDAKTRTKGKVDYSRKFSYFTPKLAVNENHHFQIGASYIPDSSNMGHDKMDKDNKNDPVALVPYKFVVKDGISYGVAYSGKFSSELSAKASFVGEAGKPIAFNKKDDTKADKKFKDLNTYVLGGELKYNDISFSAAYTNYNKSLTAKDVDLIGRDSYAYGVGVKYNLDKYAFSINQFNSNFKKSILNVTSLGIDYMVAKGFKTYVQTNFYRTNGKFIDKNDNNSIKSDKGRGVLVFLGAKVSF